MRAGDKLEKTISEYLHAFDEIMQRQEISDDLPWERVEHQLSYQNGWTREGAEVITRLARKYGGFMLRNALAVAQVMDVEDGELGY
jgi:hypothetical protein